MVTEDEGRAVTTYESTITAHDGAQVHVRVTLPIQLRWDGSGERVDSRIALPAIAHTAAADAMRNIDQARNEVPF
jgi:hypothetical protein